MFHVILYEPEIPPNTGNVIRLCANSGCTLHLVAPLGFELDDRRLRRAGLDYREYADLVVHEDLASCVASLDKARMFAVSTRGHTRHDHAAVNRGDAFLFGPETRGLPREVLESVPRERRLRIPMRAGNRSLNLSNAVAVVIYEAWRQLDFSGAGER